MRLSSDQVACMFFFFNDTPTTEIYTLSLHDALPIGDVTPNPREPMTAPPRSTAHRVALLQSVPAGELLIHEIYKSRSEEHTSELQSRQYLVCRLLLEKKKINARLQAGV